MAGEASTQDLTSIVALAVQNNCRIRVGDIEVEPLAVMMPLVPETEQKGDEAEDIDDRFAHSKLRPPDLRAMRSGGA